MKVNVLVDSSVWIEFFSGGPKAGRAGKIISQASKNRFKTPSIVLFEVYKRIKKGLDEQRANTAIAHIIDLTEIIALDERTAVHAAEKSILSGLSMADSIILATAELNNAEIKTLDKHFKGMKNAEVL
ncbi:MAG: type II toxin-antitoxin system VapC family toxin [Candidatus Diapherotrites archaeon]|nr:type II toxin-antitoxin system VapC family toxin [Candidatus Diapherotrites archaeon]